jgi:hypothetical protein
MESGLRNKTESEKRFIGISTISVVTRLALVFKREDVRSHSRCETLGGSSRII